VIIPFVGGIIEYRGRLFEQFSGGPFEVYASVQQIQLGSQ